MALRAVVACRGLPMIPALTDVAGRLVYIAAPYSATTDRERGKNIARAGMLCRLLTQLGAHPITVHAAIEAGHYGDDKIPAERETGLRAVCGIARDVVRCGGLLVALTCPDGSLSAGTRREVEAAVSAIHWGEVERVRTVSWPDLLPVLRVHGFAV